MICNFHGARCSCGTPVGLPWCRECPMDFHGNMVSSSGGFMDPSYDSLWNYHDASMGLPPMETSRGNFGSPWCCHRMPLRALYNCCLPVDFLWDGHTRTTSVGVTWDSHGTPTTSMGLSWACSAAGAYMTLPGDSHGISTGFSMGYHAIPVLP